MNPILDFNTYKDEILNEIHNYKVSENSIILRYVEQLFNEMELILFKDRSKVFEIVKNIVGIDTKLLMIREALKYDFGSIESDEDIVKYIEEDYKKYMLELSGCNKLKNPPVSIIFMPN
ncbi:DUF7006 family protein [Enterococcus faecium]|uniref:DUF7006 family protein n=1 Tax=Enterococcus faecium TaxID=1352 RepID=UPI000BEF3989|nr:hypothetical protein [Enterococcus faecium]PEH49688.1 hypothetical protein CRM75_00600 [Enterococcus faecium]